MIKDFILSPFIKLGIKILDDSIPVEKIDEFLSKKLKLISDALKKDPNLFSQQDLEKFTFIKGLYEESQNANSGIKLSGVQYPQLDESDITAWLEKLPKNKIISFKGLEPRAGEMMLCLLGNRSSDKDRFFEEQLETLLRIVEIKKESALIHKMTGYEQLQEKDKQSISILFSRFAREKEDIRFLNAAFKINDWAFLSYQNIKPGPALLDFLLALAEAEYSARELLS